MNKKRLVVLLSLSVMIGLSACAKEETTPKTEKNETKTTKKETENWQGDYGLYNERRSSTLTVTDQKENTFSFKLSSTDNVKKGNIEGKATLEENKGTFSDSKTKCDATLTKDKANITVSTTDGCADLGGDVEYDGTYALGAVPETVDKSTESSTATTTETKENTTTTTNETTTNVVAQDSSKWNGTFKHTAANASYELMIFNAIGTETDGAFDFTIDATDQGKSGYIEGKAFLKNGVGTFTNTQNSCQITFDVLDPEYTLSLSTNGKCTFYGDPSVDFGKEYKKQ